MWSLDAIKRLSTIKHKATAHITQYTVYTNFLEVEEYSLKQ